MGKLGTSHLLPGGGGGGGYIQGGGVGIFFWCTGGGVENKNPLGQGGSYISSGIWGGGQMCSIGFCFH